MSSSIDAATTPTSPADSPDRPLRLLIYGSCVSRDAYELFEPADRVELVDYVARSSVISAMSKRPFSGVSTDAIASQFRRRVVGWDLASTHLKDLIAQANFDILLLDLVDERLPVLRRDRQTFATQSPEFIETGFQLGSEERILGFTEARFRLWRQAWRRLVRQLNKAGKLQAVRLNQVYWATKLPDGSDTPAYAADPARHQQVNGALDQMYSEIGRYLNPSQVYQFLPSDLTSDPGHRWGLAAYHYPASYNQRLKAKLLAEPRPGTS
ncbi:MAG: DUF6270 domain-containing protein [Bifidobacteriaceae bacterium]|nr:DUF6270 domain-containing protein [Bifidobacteriaceae bacterium]